jgi:hypothetical protein
MIESGWPREAAACPPTAEAVQSSDRVYVTWGPGRRTFYRLQGVGGVSGQVLAPEAVDEPVDGHHPAGVQHQQRPGLGAWDHDRLLAVGDGQRPQDPKSHGRQ